MVQDVTLVRWEAEKLGVQLREPGWKPQKEEKSEEQPGQALLSDGGCEGRAEAGEEAGEGEERFFARQGAGLAQLMVAEVSFIGGVACHNQAKAIGTGPQHLGPQARPGLGCKQTQLRLSM